MPDSAAQATDRIYQLARTDDLAAANRFADAALRRFADSSALWEAAAYVRRGAGDYSGALQAYQQAGRLDPSSSNALRGQALMLRRLGAPAPAAELIRSHPELPLDEDLRAIVAEQAAWQLRYADSQDDPRERLAQLREVVVTLQALVDGAGGQVQAARKGESAAFDLVQADVMLRRESEAIRLYESMVQASIQIPPYAGVQAAIAYARTGRGDRAIDILQPLSKLQPDDLDVQLELFYALVDRDRLEAARELIDRLVQRLRAGTDRDAELRARIAQAMVRAYDERPAEAITRLDSILEQAPLSLDARTARANVYLWRGWTRRAREEALAVLSVAPRNREALALQVQSEMALDEWAAAQTHLAADIDSQALTDRDEQQLGSRIKWHQRPQILISSGYGTGSQSSVATNREWQIDAQAFTAPLADRYRVFGHLRETYTDLSPASLSRTWGGLGAEAAWPDYSASLELAGVSRESAPAAVIHGAWMPADGARIGMSAASSDPDTPARASANDIRLRTVRLTTEYNFTESTGIGADVGLGRFSDGNRQFSADLRVSQRLAASDRGKLVWSNTIGMLSDTLDAQRAPYFDPAKAYSQETELRGEWLGWRDTSLRRARWHVVTVSLGRFQQSGHDTRPMAALRYEQRWSLSDHSEFGFGIGHSLHPYDGLIESRTSVFLSYEGRL